MEHISTIVVGHFHATVVIGQRRVRHLERLHRNGTDTTQIRLIALTFKNRLLSQLNAVLFFKFAGHVFKELKFVLLLDDLGLNLNDYLFLHLALEDTVASHISEQLDGSHAPSDSTGGKEVLAVLGLTLFASLVHGILAPLLPNDLELSPDSPSIDQCTVDLFDTFILNGR